MSELFFNEAEIVAHPLDQGAGDGDASFQSIVSGLIAKFVGHRCEQSGLGVHFAGAGVHQQEAASAVGVFGFAGFETSLADKGGLLIAENPGDGHVFYVRFFRESVIFAAGANCRKHGSRDSEGVEKFLVPGQCLEIHQLRAAGIGNIGDVDAALGTAGEVPEQEGVNVAENGVVGLGEFADTFYIFENPANLEATEICGEGQAGLGAKTVLTSGLCQLRDVIGDAGVLPDESVCEGLAGFAIPDDGGFALIGDADRGQVLGLEISFRHRFEYHFAGTLPDFFRVVFDPTGLGINLLVFLLGDRDGAARAVEDDESTAGCALIDCANVVCHGTPPENASGSPGDQSAAEPAPEFLSGALARVAD